MSGGGASLENGKEIQFNNCPTRCDCIQFITFLYAALHVLGVDTHHQELVQL